MDSKISVIYSRMKQRCNNPNDSHYKWYYAKGIKVKMTKDELFSLWIRDKAFKMKQPSIDRIDSNGHYEFSNCRFIEHKRNLFKKGHFACNAKLDENKVREIKRLYKDKLGTQAEIGRKFGVKRRTVEDVVHGRNWFWVK